jgi:large subunit ribosomal protein L15
MVVNRRKKCVKYRGSKTHGKGSMKKRRGHGNRGGTGNAGTGKRADSKKPSIWKDPKYFGRYGFVNKNSKKIRAIDIGDIETHIEDYKEKIKISKDKIEIILKNIGYDKVLGGKAKNLKYKYFIKAEYASANAIERVEKAGGKIETPETGILEEKEEKKIEKKVTEKKETKKAAAEEVEEETEEEFEEE